MNLQDIGLVGLTVMGQNLVFNMERNGFGVAVYNRTESNTKTFVEGPASGKNITAAYSLKDLFASLKKPRKVIIMVKAGAPIDEVIAQLKPYLALGDLAMCDGCPDITVWKDQLGWSCRLEEQMKFGCFVRAVPRQGIKTRPHELFRKG